MIVRDQNLAVNDNRHQLTEGDVSNMTIHSVKLHFSLITMTSLEGTQMAYDIINVLVLFINTNSHT